jgi:hypothetical protein
MRIEGLITNKNAGGEVLPYRIVKFGANDNAVIQAAAATDASIGVADQLGADAAGHPIDVIRSGIAEVEYGGNVTRGVALTADSQGRAIAATAGANVRIIGFAEVSGVVGDIGSVHIAPGFIS